MPIYHLLDFLIMQHNIPYVALGRGKTRIRKAKNRCTLYKSICFGTKNAVKRFTLHRQEKAMTTDDSPYVDQVLLNLEARLRVLETQAATYGLDTPPHIVIEIEDLKGKIEETKMSHKSIISVQLLARMEPNERWKRLYDAIWEIEIILYTLQKNVAADRLRLQARHTEFNTALQRTMIDVEYAKRMKAREYAAVALLFVLVAILFYLN